MTILANIIGYAAVMALLWVEHWLTLWENSYRRY